MAKDIDYDQLTPEEAQKLIDEYKEAASVHQTAAKNQIKTFLKTGVFVLAALAVLVLLSIAWFAMNHRTNSKIGGISATYDGFELASDGSKGVYDDLIDNYKEEKFFVDGEDFHGLDDAGNTVDLKSTYEEKQSIRWMMSVEGNLKNNPEIEEIEDRGLEPGSYGKLVFYIIPSEDGTMGIDCTLSEILYGTTVKVGEELPKEAIVKDTNSNKTKFTYYMPSTDVVAKYFFEKHIMYFQDREETNGRYIYKDRIDEKAFHIDIEDAKAGVAYKQTIYWIWPYVMGQLLLPENDINLGVYPKLIGGDDQESLITDMAENKEAYFYDITSTVLPDITEENLQNIGKGSASRDFENEKFGSFSTCWNRADQYIGINVSYVLVELTAVRTEY